VKRFACQCGRNDLKFENTKLSDVPRLPIASIDNTDECGNVAYVPHAGNLDLLARPLVKFLSGKLGHPYRSADSHAKPMNFHTQII
jgi:hypothetical protein